MITLYIAPSLLSETYNQRYEPGERIATGR